MRYIPWLEWGHVLIDDLESWCDDNSLAMREHREPPA